jgi:hypothetical protein
MHKEKMSKRTKSNWRAQSMFAAIGTIAFMFAASPHAAAQGKYKVGDRVECEITGTLPGKHWMKGMITPFAKGDFGPGGEPDGSWFHFKADANGVEYPCKPEHIRGMAGADTNTVKKTEATEEPVTTAQEDRDAQTPTGDFLECPITQKQVKNGSRPDPELVKKIIRCNKGEKGVEKGEEGAVKVDVTAIQIGASRPWSYSQDIGNAKPGSVVYPVKATYTVNTIYRTATDVQANWIRILNFYVNAFGEWQIGSEEPIKSPAIKRVPR